jgi:hypothetical protein
VILVKKISRQDMEKKLVNIASVLLILVSCSAIAGCDQLIKETDDNSKKQCRASISGHVYRADTREPIAGARVWASGPHATGPVGEDADDKGNYTIDELCAGESLVIATANGYVTRYYNGKDGTYIPDKAAQVTTVNGKNTRDIDLALEWGGSIIGKVYETDGITPIGDARIHYLQVSGDKTPRLGGCAPMPPRDSVKSDSSGNYQIGGLLSGEYDLLVSYKLGDEVLYSRVITSVTKGKETRGVNFILEPGGSISGYVYENDGVTLVAGQWVPTSLATVSDFGTTSSQDGSYSLNNLPPGEYRLWGETIILSSGEHIVHDIILPK